MSPTERASVDAESGRAWSRSWPLLYLAAVTAGLLALFGAWAYDDPFITYRYADNLARGLGFVYNPGERVLSTTTPLFALLLALLAHLWPDLPRVAVLLGAATLAGGGLCLRALGRSWHSPWAGLAGLLLYPTFPAVVTTLGSETPLYLFLCLAALAAYARERYGWTAALCAGAVLVRPDGALVPLVLAAHYLLRRRPAQGQGVPWRALLAFAGLTLPWLAFSLWYFGSPLPATLFSKQHQGQMMISQGFAAGLARTAQLYAAAWPFGLEGLLLGMGLAMLAWRFRSWALLLSWTFAYALAYGALGVTSYFWYYAPLVPMTVAGVGLGLDGLQRLLARLRKGVWATALSLALLAILLLGQGRNLWERSQHPDTRVAAYIAVGRWLAANTTQTATVGALEVGIIGYYARRPMVDFAGLIQPEVAAQLQAATTYEDAALWAMKRYGPQYLVLIDGAFPRLETGPVAQLCHPVQRFPSDAYGSRTDLTVYACTGN